MNEAPERSSCSRPLQLLRWLNRRQITALVALLVVVGGGWAFVELADEVLEGDTIRFDKRVMTALRVEKEGRLDTPIGPKWLHNAARDITALGGIPVLCLVVGAVVGLLLLVKDHAAAVLVAATTLTGALVGLGLKALFDRDRPDFLKHLDDVLTSSFPSGHSMMAAIVYLTLGVLLANFVRQTRLKSYFLAVALGLTVMVGLSRVYLGVHYPTDVLAGWTAGLVWATFCGLLAESAKRIWRKRSTISVEARDTPPAPDQPS